MNVVSLAESHPCTVEAFENGELQSHWRRNGAFVGGVNVLVSPYESLPEITLVIVNARLEPGEPVQATLIVYPDEYITVTGYIGDADDNDESPMAGALTKVCNDLIVQLLSDYKVEKS